MLKRSLLIVDNDLEFLETRAALIGAEGFRVYSASSREEAERILQDIDPQVIVMDIRLRDDGDGKDTSGLTFAKLEAYIHIPKIMMTRWPTYQAVREALGPAIKGLPPAVEFIAKQEGHEAMLEAIARIFDRYVRVNWELAILTGSNAASLVELARIVAPALPQDLLIQRAEELEYLLRRLFYDSDSLRLDRVLWQSDSHVALGVFAFDKTRGPESLVIVFGSQSTIEAESERYRRFAPPTLALSTTLKESMFALHTAACVYTLVGANLEDLVSMADLYKVSPERGFNSTLQYLFETTLAEWHQNKRVIPDGKNLVSLHTEAMNLNSLTTAALSKRVRAIVRLAPTNRENLELSEGLLTIRFGDLVFSYPDPSCALDQLRELDYSTVLTNSPGTVSGQNVLAESNGRAWVTSFSDAGLLPVLWNHVSLEAAMRFEWTDNARLQMLHDLERALIYGDFNRIDQSEIDQHLRKPLRAIHTVRRLAGSDAGKDAMPYHLGVLFQALKRLADFDPDLPLMPGELNRLAHILIAAAMICGRLKLKGNASSEHPNAVSGIRLDDSNRVAWVDGVRIPLRGNGYEILRCLDGASGRRCTRRELIEKVFKEQYDELDPSQIARLNTAVRRLRERIEADPDNPRYILTEPGRGYRLMNAVSVK